MVVGFAGEEEVGGNLFNELDFPDPLFHRNGKKSSSNKPFNNFIFQVCFLKAMVIIY